MFVVVEKEKGGKKARESLHEKSRLMKSQKR